MLRYLFNFLYPPRCAVCGDRFGPSPSRGAYASMPAAGRESLRAPICASAARRSSRPLRPIGKSLSRMPRRRRTSPALARSRAIALASEEDRAPLPSLIRRHKYGLDQSLQHALAEFLGDPTPLLFRRLRCRNPGAAASGRLWWRGFNQAALLAMTISRRLDSRSSCGH